MLNILILGGTGAMGVHLKDCLLEAGHEVYITSRSAHKSEGRLHYFCGNAMDSGFINQVLNSQSWDAIVDFMVYDTDLFKTRCESLLSATRQYVFISSSRVYSNHDKYITEETPRLLDVSNDIEYLATDEYALRKAREEDILKNSGYTNYTIIRPYITYSENRLQLGDLEHSNWLYRALAGRTIVFSKDVANHYTTLTYGKDVAYGIAVLIGKTEAFGQAFHITSSTSILWKDVLEIYLNAIEKCTGVRPKVKMIDKSMKLSDESSKYQILCDRLYDRRFDNSKIQHFIKREFMTPQEGLPKCINEFVKNWKSTKISYLEEAERDIITQEHIPLREIDTLRNKIIYISCRYFRMSNVLRRIVMLNK